LPVFGLINPLRVAAVWFLADRFRFDHRSWRRNVLLHVFAALLLTYVHAMTVGLYFTLIGPAVTVSTFVNRFYTELLSVFQLDFLWYWAVLGGFYTFHYYSVSQQRLVVTAQLQTSLMQARLQALRSQLNPHFLFNTLNTISVLALKGERKAVINTLEILGNLLRIALDDNRSTCIPLRDELEFVDGYLEICRIRFADRLTIYRDVAPEVLQALVPAMILEPVVENAIKHGVSACDGGQTITIHAARQEGILRLEVSDSGPGFQMNTPRSPAKRIGLSNTEARLEQLYGHAQAIEYGSAPGGGASVTISIPFCDSASALSQSEGKSAA
jgi:signal transduction histidine kinase